MQMRDRDRFEQYFEPVLRLLATVSEPVSIRDVAAWLPSIAPQRIREVTEEWRQYLNEQVFDDGEVRYRVYHSSFKDFLAVEGMGLKPYHEIIASSALGKVPGFEDAGPP